MADRLGGIYTRYSDDILFVMPSVENIGKFRRQVGYLLALTAPRLILNKGKTEIGQYWLENGRQHYNWVMGSSKNGISYLGFRYDGAKAYLRNSTISSLHRSFSAIANSYAYRYVKSMPSRSADEILLSMPMHRIREKVGKVEGFKYLDSSPQNWTFWTYVNRSETCFKDFGSGIQRQMRKNIVVFDTKTRTAVARAVREVRHPNFGSSKKKV